MAKQSKVNPKETFAARVLEGGLNEPVQAIPRLEICAVRDLRPQGKGEMTPDLIAALAANHDPESTEAPVTLDHAQEGPAYGWIDKVWVEGEKLFASLKSVPVSLVNAIKNERYRSRSIEFFRDWNGTGMPKLTAVSFLGAALPAIEGLKPVSLSRGIGGVEHENADTPIAGATFADQLPGAEKLSAAPPPAGVSVAGLVIVRDDRTSEVMGHGHACYLDADGNGYTDSPREWNEAMGCYEAEESGHQHGVNGYLVEPAADENGVIHTHNIYKPTMLAKETLAMSDKNPAPTAPAQNPEVETLRAALEAERAERKADAEKIETLRAEMFARDQAAAFDGVWATAQAEGRVTPAQRAGEFAVFNALPPDGAGVVKLSAADGKQIEIGPRALALKNLQERPAVVALGRVTNPTAMGAQGGSEDPAADKRKAHTEAAIKLAAEKGISIESALVQTASK